jgi:hypothetical protein
MASLDDDFFEQRAFKSKIKKLMALSKMSRCRVDYDGPSIPIPSPVREMDQKTEVTKDPVLPSDDGSVMRRDCTRLYLSRDLEKLTTPTRQCT